jgi:hypothetical protein
MQWRLVYIHMTRTESGRSVISNIVSNSKVDGKMLWEEERPAILTEIVHSILR